MPAVQSKSSSSKAQSARPATEDVLKIPRNWHVPFVSFLEVQQASWDKIDRLPDPGPERQSFLRQQRDALVEWAELEELQDHLPERASLKNALASYFVNRAAPDKAKRAGKEKSILPKKIKAKYSDADVIKAMFKQWVLDKTKEIANERGLSKVMMASKEALRQVTAELTDKEALDVC
ncbi:hypothetical protein HWV62_21082 [Athelia sp. TMB]|nr:hypothetical protein HWV62_21082 [Athelia sp. TMB]